MSDLQKINFITRDYENSFIYDDDNNTYEKDNVSIFQLPESTDFLTIFILFDKFDDKTHAQLVNCITSIKTQTFFNIKTTIINFDTSYKAQNTVNKIATNINSKVITLTKKSIDEGLDSLIKNCTSKYTSIINYTDIIPRVKDIEFVTKTLFEKDYDFLTLTVKYFDASGNMLNIKYDDNITLKSTINTHYSAYFKTEILKQYKFSKLNTNPLDEAMVTIFEQNNKKGNHITSKTQMTFIEKLDTKK